MEFELGVLCILVKCIAFKPVLKYPIHIIDCHVEYIIGIRKIGFLVIHMQLTMNTIASGCCLFSSVVRRPSTFALKHLLLRNHIWISNGALKPLLSQTIFAINTILSSTSLKATDFLRQANRSFIAKRSDSNLKSLVLWWNYFTPFIDKL